MDAQSTIIGLVDILVVFATNWLIPSMVVLFFVAIALRALIYYTVKRELWFAKEFEKRVDNYLVDNEVGSEVSFYVFTKKMLEKTFYELFEMRFFLKHSKPDFIMSLADRIFLIKQGSAWFVNDILRHIKNLRYNENSHPKLFDISKKTLSRNPCFSKVFGVFPTSVMTDVLNILPGIFIILGVFGTFLGIMKALPELGAMDLGDVEATKHVMDQFLLKISFSMSTSLVGIMLSVCASFINASFAPERVFVTSVDTLESSFDTLWHISTNNSIPKGLTEFDEDRDPEEALAEQALQKELLTGRGLPKKAAS